MKNRVVWLIALILVLLSGTVTMAETRRALIVGINNYDRTHSSDSVSNCLGKKKISSEIAAMPRIPRKTWETLDGAINDAMAMREVLTTIYGFKPENVLMLTDKEATRETICSAIRTHLIEAAVPGDSSVFFFAGHGSQVKNSLSKEAEKKDQSIVPVDGWDIRDKELARLFNQALDKGIILTAIFDSCHSGSILRGEQVKHKTRFAPENPNDAMDPPDEGPTPEERGALIMSAAQKFEEAEEVVPSSENKVPHGAFTWALLRALRNPQVNETASDVFASVTGQLKAMGKVQRPVLAGLWERKRSPLFGGQIARASERIRVPIVMTKEGKLEILAGHALGINPNSELTKVTGTQANASAGQVRIRITNVENLSRSSAEVITGRVEDIQSGDLFELDRWGLPTTALLRVWLPPALSKEELARLVPALEQLRQEGKVAWVDDPTTTTPTHIIAWDGTTWKVSRQGREAMEVGPSLQADKILEILNTEPTPLQVFLRIPPPMELVTRVKEGIGQSRRSAEIVAVPAQAHYLLTGRMRGNLLEFAWTLPNVSMEDKEAKNFPLPLHTTWVPYEATSIQTIPMIVHRLERDLWGLAKLRGWLTLESPLGEELFPYKLGLNDHTTKQPAGERIKEGNIYQLVLVAEAEKLKQGVQRRFVYVLLMNSEGQIQLLFPPSKQGNEGNYFPGRIKKGQSFPTEILLEGALIKVTEPLGLDTYILLATEEEIAEPDIVFQSDSVQTRSQNLESPLAVLLNRIGTATRAGATSVPTNWSISRLPILSVPQEGS